MVDRHTPSMPDDSDFDKFTLPTLSTTEIDAVDCVTAWMTNRPSVFAHATYRQQPDATEVLVRETGPAATTALTLALDASHQLHLTSTQAPPLLNNDTIEDPLPTSVAAPASDERLHDPNAETTLPLRGVTPANIQLIDPPSPYDLFRAHRKMFSVSDLVAPLWSAHFQ